MPVKQARRKPNTEGPLTRGGNTDPGVLVLSELPVLAATRRAEVHDQPHRFPGRRSCAISACPAARQRRRKCVPSPRLSSREARSRAGGRDAWKLTPCGRRRLERANRNGNIESLPESPQHQEWRLASAQALEAFEPLHEELSQTIRRVSTLLTGDFATAQEWAELGCQLQGQCERIASATYCLHEWLEPDDARPDPAVQQRKHTLNGGRVPKVKPARRSA
jgi:hypothetical protein